MHGQALMPATCSPKLLSGKGSGPTGKADGQGQQQPADCISSSQTLQCNLWLQNLPTLDSAEN